MLRSYEHPILTHLNQAPRPQGRFCSAGGRQGASGRVGPASGSAAAVEAIGVLVAVLQLALGDRHAQQACGDGDAQKSQSGPLLWGVICHLNSADCWLKLPG